jgi:hypothetical protein
MRKTIYLIFFIVGIILLCITIFGYFTPLRSPDVYQLNRGTLFEIDLTEKDAWDIIQNTCVGRKQYIINVNSAVDRSVTHYWGEKDVVINGVLGRAQDPEGIERYHLHVPIQENYILFVVGYLIPDNFNKYIFTDYRKGLDRGVCGCSQSAIILNGVLQSKNIESHLILTPQHSVVDALVDPETNEWWVLDPDYGVVIPHSLDELKENPDLVRSYYSEKIYNNATVDSLVVPYKNVQNIRVFSGISEYSRYLYPFEKLSYLLIWIIPLCLIFPFTITILQNMKKKIQWKQK